MTIYQRMERVFTLADVPGFFQTWRKTDDHPELPDLYAVYNVTQERPAQCADDREIFRLYSVTVWLYGVGDVTAAADLILDALSMEGFGTPRGADAYAGIPGAHINVKRIDAHYVDYGEYGQ